MDRAREAGARRHHRGRHAARLIVRCATIGVAALACRGLSIDPARVIAIEVPTTAPTVREGDTLRLTARLLNAAGAPVAGATPTWVTDDTVTSFTLDTGTGLVTGVTPGSGRVWARFESLQSDPLTLTVTALPAPVAGSPHRPVIVSPP